MNPNISYDGDLACAVANVCADDTAALTDATRQLMEPSSGVSGVRVEHFLSEREVEKIMADSRGILRRRMMSASLDNELHTIGVPQQTSRGSIDLYFDVAEAWREDDVFMKVVGPDSAVVRRTVRLLESAYGKRFLPAKQGNRELLPATLRCIDFATTHKDVIASQVDWSIGKLQNDIAWNIYLRMPKEGGELIHYPPVAERVQKQHELDRFAPLSLRPNPGDLVFFRSGIPHGVARSGTDNTRLTVSGCAAFEPPPGKEARFWA